MTTLDRNFYIAIGGIIVTFFFLLAGIYVVLRSQQTGTTPLDIPQTTPV